MHPAISLPKCLSSHMTTHLLKFRNPQGSEENWFNQEQKNNNRIVYIGKIFTTEIASALLFITATIESVAYGVLFLGLFVLRACTRYLIPHSPKISSMNQSCKYLRDLGSSSRFTMYWNLANLLVFNIFCKNIFTNESFARFSFKHLESGNVFNATLTLCLDIFALFAAYNRASVDPLLRSKISSISVKTRSRDIFYINEWSTAHPISNPLAIQSQLNLSKLISLNHSIQEGANFILQLNNFNDYMDPQISRFILTKVIYLYIFGEKTREPAPTLLKKTTQESIIQLRSNLSKYSSKVNVGLSWYLSEILRDLKRFNTDFFSPHSDPYFQQACLDPLKKIVEEEFQDSLFLKYCWKLALKNFKNSNQ